MDIALSTGTFTTAAAGFARLVAAVAAAEGAFRRLAAGLAGEHASGRDLLDEALRLERERLRLVGESNAAYRRQGDLIAGAAAEQEKAADRARDVWEGFGNELAGTFATLFERIARDGGLRFDALFRTLGPLISDLLGRLTGLDVSPLLGALAKGPGGGGTLGWATIGGLIGQVGGLIGSIFGGAGGVGSAIGRLLPIPGVNVVAAALPLIAGLFEDKDHPFAKAGIGVSGGNVASDPFALDGGPVDQIARLGERVASALQNAFDGLGASVADLADLTAIGYSSGRKSILPKGFFAGIDATRGADFASGAVFSGLDDPEEAVLRAVQSGLLRAFRTGAVQGVDGYDADTVTVGLRRALASGFTTLSDGLADVDFLRDYGRTLERLKAAGDPAALQGLDLRERAEQQGAEDAGRVREFLERAARLFAPLTPAVPDALAAATAAPALGQDEGRLVDPVGAAGGRAITDEGSAIGYEDPAPSPAPGVGSIVELPAGDDDLAAERLADARAAIDDYVRALLGIADAAADTRPLAGYALQLAEAEARLDGLSAALREAGYSAEETAALIEQGKDAARERLRDSFQDELARDLRGARGLGVVDQVSGLVEAYDTRRAEGSALGAELSGLDELLRLQVEALVSAGGLSVAALEALRTEFADNAIVGDALTRALSLQAAAANDNAAAQLTLADVTRLATRELDEQVREQEQVRRSAEAVVEAIADTRRRLALDPSLSALSPAEQLAQARRHFDDLATRSLAGDQAAQARLPEAGEAYLELARDFYASNEDYARVFRQVDGVLRETADVADRQLQVAEAQLEELRELRRALTGEPGDLPNPAADFGRNPTRNRILARLTGYAGDFGSGGFGTFRAGLSPEVGTLVDTIAAAVNFADGGVMTAGGALELHRYAFGGIARRPQLALFGEGRLPEAFVPLPDGRSIPVTVSVPANDAGRGEPDPGAARRTAGIETLVEETRRLRAELAGLRGENATLRRSLERLAAGTGAGRAA